MSRMRLMQGEQAGATALVCLYCGTETESRPPYAVVYCHCRSEGASPDAPHGTSRQARER